MAATARGATLLGPDKLEIREYPIPDIPPDGGLVKVEMGGVCGTDVKYLHGKLRLIIRSFSAMRFSAVSRSSAKMPRPFIT